VLQLATTGVVLALVAVGLYRLPGMTARQARVLVLLACVLAAVMSASMFKYTVDDSYISLRYARNWARGYGPVFNRGAHQPVEGYTNFLWVAVGTLFFRLGVTPEAAVTVAKLLGVAACIASIPLLYWLGRTTWGDPGTAAGAAIIWAAVPYVWFWAAAGLETGLFLLLLIASVNMTICAASRGPGWWVGSGVCFALCAMTRPEGALLAVVTWGSVLILERAAARRAIIIGILSFLALYGTYFVWRWSFYGYLLPNSFYAKTAIRGEALCWLLARKIAEHGRFIQYLAPLVVAVAYLGASRRLSQRARMLLGVAFAAFALAFVASRQWMPGYRYDLPAAPLIIVLAAPAVVLLLSRLQRGWRLVAVAAALAYLVFPMYGLMLQRNYYDRLKASHIAFGKWLGQWAPEDASFAGIDMGAIPYYSDLPKVVDIHPEGLLDADTAHSGFDAQRVMSARPSFIALPYGPPRIVSDEEIPAPSGPTGEIWASRVFQKEYRYVFTTCWSPMHNMRVYVRTDLDLSSGALEAGYAMARESIAANNHPPPGVR